MLASSGVSSPALTFCAFPLTVKETVAEFLLTYQNFRVFFVAEYSVHFYLDKNSSTFGLVVTRIRHRTQF